MAEKYMFFDSIDGEDERFYTADEFAEYFRQFIRNGIFAGGGNLKVGADARDMTISINEGYAWLEGYLYKIDTNPLSLYLETADAELNRIDRIVIRLDKSLEKRYVKAFVLKGQAAETPSPPLLTRDENTYEIALAQVEVLAGKSFIEAYQIRDERLDNSVCGIVTHLFEQVDTSKLFDEWQNYLNSKKAEGDQDFIDFKEHVSQTTDKVSLEYTVFLAMLQSKFTSFESTWSSWVDDNLSIPNGEFYKEWKSWFERIKYDWDNWFKREAKRVWNTWVEDKLSSPGGEFYREWKIWFDEIQDLTNLVTLSQFKSHKDKSVRDEVHGLRISGNKLEAEINKGVWRKLESLPAIKTWGGM